MPWSTEDVLRHNEKATTPKLRRAWVSAANRALQSSGDDGSAIRIANSVVNKLIVRGSKKRKRAA